MKKDTDRGICRHVQSEGQYGVFVDPGCRMSHMIKGILVTAKHRCEDCPYWKPKEGKE